MTCGLYLVLQSVQRQEQRVLRVLTSETSAVLVGSLSDADPVHFFSRLSWKGSSATMIAQRMINQ